MPLLACPYCLTSLEEIVPRGRGAHVVNCKLNPNRDIATAKRSASKVKTALREFICANCGKKFNKVLAPCRLKEKMYCSRSCANSRPQTEETKKRISASLTGRVVGGGNSWGLPDDPLVKERLVKLRLRIRLHRNTLYEEIFASWVKGERHPSLSKNPISAAVLLKRVMIFKLGSACQKCGSNQINPFSGKPIVQLEHINGNCEDNSYENIKLLCPNCHAMTPTFGALNKGSGRKIRLGIEK